MYGDFTYIDIIQVQVACMLFVHMFVVCEWYACKTIMYACFAVHNFGKVTLLIFKLAINFSLGINVACNLVAATRNFLHN